MRSRFAIAAVLLWLTALPALTGCSPAPSYQALDAGAVVLAFGDSITYGTGAGSEPGYPERLAELTGWQVINTGVPGDTADRARGRLQALLDEHEPELVIVELGGNDFLRRRSEIRVKEDLRHIVRAVQNKGGIPALVAVPRLSLLRATAGALDDAPLYAELAEEESILLIDDVLSEVLSDDGLRSDPIHPDTRGYQQLAEGIAARLQRAGLW